MTLKEKVLNHYDGNTELVEAYIKALKKLFDLYVERKYKEDCPLCIVGHLNLPMGEECHSCPWKVLLNASCDSVHEIIYVKRKKEIRKREILRWIKSYTKALEEMKHGH